MQMTYEFRFDDTRVEQFELSFDDTSLTLSPIAGEFDESWIALDFHQCSNCPLDKENNPYCPVARNLSTVLLRFRDDFSYSPVEIHVVTEPRTISRNGTLQEGISPVMGLIMATSGCPVLDIFKPMAYTHLPFSTETETILRSVAFYLTGQLMRARAGKSADWKLEKFNDMYMGISEINAAFSERVRQIQGKDANINALVILDIFAQMGSMTLDESELVDLQPLFSAFLERNQ